MGAPYMLIHKDNSHIMMILKLTINYKANFTQTLLLLTIIHAYYIVILSVSLIDSQLINSSRQKMPDILSLNSFLLFCFLSNICSIAALATGGSRKFCQCGPTLSFFVCLFLVDEGREDPIITINRPSSARQRNAI